MPDLFDNLPPPPKKSKSPSEKNRPLADRMRPATLDQVVGQGHIVGPDKPLRRQIELDQIPSLIFWGPPGSGKTTLARVIAHHSKASFHPLPAVLSGVKELKEIIELAKREQRFEGRRTILFVDEIHRWNKAQQDALLPHVEDGTITLIGATTENPSFEIIAPLLSRAKVSVLNPLTHEELKIILERAAIPIDSEAMNYICATSDGDARRALNTLEIAASLVGAPSPLAGEGGRRPGEGVITLKTVEQALQKKSILYDKGGEEHYNLISAFIKSMRGSDADAAVYWLARMLEAGEEPLFLARRMVIFASEDVGNADPQAIRVAVSAMQAFDFVGMPEGWIPLAQAATYLATAPKSKASYFAYLEAKGDVEKEGYLPVPLHLRNAPTPLMKELGYGKGDKTNFLPEKLKGRRYYNPPTSTSS